MYLSEEEKNQLDQFKISILLIDESKLSQAECNAKNEIMIKLGDLLLEGGNFFSDNIIKEVHLLVATYFPGYKAAYSAIFNTKLPQDPNPYGFPLSSIDIALKCNIELVNAYYILLESIKTAFEANNFFKTTHGSALILVQAGIAKKCKVMEATGKALNILADINNKTPQHTLSNINNKTTQVEEIGKNLALSFEYFKALLQNEISHTTPDAADQQLAFHVVLFLLLNKKEFELARKWDEFRGEGYKQLLNPEARKPFLVICRNDNDFKNNFYRLVVIIRENFYPAREVGSKIKALLSLSSNINALPSFFVRSYGKDALPQPNLYEFKQKLRSFIEEVNIQRVQTENAKDKQNVTHIVKLEELNRLDKILKECQSELEKFSTIDMLFDLAPALVEKLNAIEVVATISETRLDAHLSHLKGVLQTVADLNKNVGKRKREQLPDDEGEANAQEELQKLQKLEQFLELDLDNIDFSLQP